MSLLILLGNAVVPFIIIYGLMYRHYKKKSEGELQGYPGAVLIILANLFMAIAINPYYSGIKREDNINGIIGGLLFFIIFLLLGRWRFKKALNKNKE